MIFWLIQSILFFHIVSGVVTEYVTTLSAADFKMSSGGPHDFLTITDNSVTTGVISDSSTSDANQSLRIRISSTGDDVRVGSVFLFVDEAQTQSGTIEIHAHSTENTDLTSPDTKCITFGSNGGVLNCRKNGSYASAQYITVYCSVSCSPALSVNILRITAEFQLSAASSLVAATGSTFSSANSNIEEIHKTGSYLSSQNGNQEMTVSGNSLLSYARLVLEFPGGVNYEITTVWIIAEQSQSNWQIRGIDNSSEVSIPNPADVCTVTPMALSFLVVQNCNLQRKQMVVEQLTLGQSMTITKVVAFGRMCQNIIRPKIYTKNIIVTTAGLQGSPQQPEYVNNCLETDKIINDFTFQDYYTGVPYTGWISEGSGTMLQHIIVTITSAEFAQADSQSKIKVRMVANFQDQYGSQLTNSDVIWTFTLQVQCDSTFTLDLATPSNYASPITETITALGFSKLVAYPQYTTICISTASLITYSYIGSGAIPLAWISQSTSATHFSVAPQDEDYKINSENTVQVSLSASDGVTQANTLVILELIFPKYADLVCPSTDLSTKEALTQFTFTMPIDGSANTEKFYVPLVVDSVSQVKLDDASGLVGCGPREYTLNTLTDKLQFDALTQALTLKSTMTKVNAGAYTADIEVKLLDYPTVKKTFQLNVTLIVPTVPAEPEKKEEEEKDPTPVPTPKPPSDRSDPACTIIRFIEQNVAGLHNDTVQSLPENITLPDNAYPLNLAYNVPLYVPLPFCGDSFLNVTYTLKTGRNQNAASWTEPWLKLDTSKKQIIIQIGSSAQMPKKQHSVCLQAQIAQSTRKKCLEIIPPVQQPFTVDDDGWQQDRNNTKTNPTIVVSIEEEIKELFVNQNALLNEFLKLMQARYPEDYFVNGLISKDEGLKFKIVKVSVSGEVIIKFSEAVFQFEELLAGDSESEQNRQFIDVAYCYDQECNVASEVIDPKYWVEVSLIQGRDSNITKILGINSTQIEFIDSKTLKMQVKFDNSLEISLNQYEEMLEVKLWGPFLTAASLEPIAEKNRAQVKAIPPQLLEDWASKAIQTSIEDKIVQSATFIPICTNILQKLFTKGALNSVLSMITGVQLIVHSPLINVQFPANAFILYEELIQLSTFEVLPTQDLFPLFMDFPQDKEPFNEKFERLDYGEWHSIMLLGTIFLVIVWMVTLYPIYLLLLCCRKRFLWPENIIKSMRKSLFWNQWPIFTFTFFIEIFICAHLQGHIFYDNWLETPWVLTSFILWLLCIILIINLFFVIFLRICPKVCRKEISEKQLKSEYGELINQVNVMRGSKVMLFHVSYFLRRIGLTIVTIYLNGPPMIQVLTVLVIDLLGAAIQAHVKPAESPMDNYFQLFDEVTLCFIISSLTCCTELINDGESRYMVGYFIIVLTLQNIGINLIFLILMPLNKLRLWCKFCHAFRKKTKGKTIEFTKRRLKQKLSKTLSATIDFLEPQTFQNQTTKGAVAVTELAIKKDEVPQKIPLIVIDEEEEEKGESDKSSGNIDDSGFHNPKFSSSNRSQLAADYIYDEDGACRSMRFREQNTARMLLTDQGQNYSSLACQPEVKMDDTKIEKLLGENQDKFMNLCNNIELQFTSPSNKEQNGPRERRMSFTNKTKNHNTEVIKPLHVFSQSFISENQDVTSAGKDPITLRKKYSNNFINEENSSKETIEPENLVADLFKIKTKDTPSQLGYDQPIRFNLASNNFKDSLKDSNASRSQGALSQRSVKLNNLPHLSISSASISVQTSNNLNSQKAKSYKNKIRSNSSARKSEPQHSNSSRQQNFILPSEKRENENSLLNLSPNDSSMREKQTNNCKLMVSQLESTSNKKNQSSTISHLWPDKHSPNEEHKAAKLYQEVNTISCQNIQVQWPQVDEMFKRQQQSDRTERHIGPSKLRITPWKIKQIQSQKYIEQHQSFASSSMVSKDQISGSQSHREKLRSHFADQQAL